MAPSRRTTLATVATATCGAALWGWSLLASHADVLEQPDPDLGDSVDVDLEAGTRSATRHGEERVTGRVPGSFVLTVVDAETKEPVAGATVVLRTTPPSAPAAAERLHTDGGGRVELSERQRRDRQIQIEHPGYVDHVCRETALAERIVELQPAGRIVVHVLDARGAARPGARLRLLPPPLATGERMAPIDTTCDENGHATWTKLRPGTTYRYMLLAPALGTPTPEHERSRCVSDDEAGIKIEDPAPEGLSGRFEVRARETTSLQCTLIDTASIRGRFASDRATLTPQVKLFRIGRPVTSKRGRSAIAFELVRFVAAKRDGSFEIDGVRPGDYLLRAWWKRGHDVYFACRAARVGPSTTCDVGTVLPKTGQSLRVTLRMRDEVGERVDPTLVFEPGEHRIEGVLSIATVPASRDARDSIAELVSLPFDQPHVLHGLAAGRAHVSAQRANWLRLDAKRWHGAKNSKPVSFAIGSQGDVDCAVVVQSNRGRALIAQLPGGKRVRIPSVLLRGVRSANGRRIAVHDSRVRIPRGEHSLHARVVIDGRGYIGEAHVRQGEVAHEGPPIVLALRADGS